MTQPDYNLDRTSPDVDGYLEECRRLDREGPDPDEPPADDPVDDEVCPECDGLRVIPDGDEDGTQCPACWSPPKVKR